MAGIRIPDHLIAEVRFWPKVNKDSGHRVPHMESDCWLWTASRSPYGYGNFIITWKGRQSGTAHVFSWRLHYGEIAPRTVVRHRCDVPHCVNPTHLLIGTQADNIHDMVNRGRHENVDRKFCRAGHPFTKENVYVSPKGQRHCRICKRLHQTGHE